MQIEFISAIYELYNLVLGVETEERLLRAQGVMFSLMRNNEKLRKLLLLEYEKKKDYLPFVATKAYLGEFGSIEIFRGNEKE